MTDVTRAEFDQLVARVGALDGKSPTPPTPVPPVPIPPLHPASMLTMSTVAIVPSLSGFNAAGVITASVGITLAHLQIAVRGPGAPDVAFNDGVVLHAGVPFKLSATVPIAAAGSYTAFLAYSVEGLSWVNGPVTSFTIPPVVPAPAPPVVDRRVALVGHSKVRSEAARFNSIVFRMNPADAETFGAARGNPVDGLLGFAGRQQWVNLNWTPAGYADWLASGRLIVWSMPHAPESEGDAMNTNGANNAYAPQQRALGALLAGAGLNAANFVVRLDWESNGNWYHWSADRPGGVPALRASIVNCVTNLRAGGLTKARFDLCFNKGPSQAGADFAIFPGAQYIDVVAIDEYDMWSPSFTASDWAREMAKSPSIQSVADFAKAHGIMWAIDEGGNTHGDANQGGDNPYYWQALYATIQANIATCAWHNTYDDPGSPATLHHDFASNPKSYATYRQLWSPS